MDHFGHSGVLHKMTFLEKLQGNCWAQWHPSQKFKCRPAFPKQQQQTNTTTTTTTTQQQQQQEKQQHTNNNKEQGTL